MLDLYNRIAALAAEKGLTLNALAKKAKITPSSFYDLKSGRIQDLSRKTAEKIATALEISVEELYKSKIAPDADAPEADERFMRIWAIYSALPDADRENADKYLAFLLDTQKSE